MVYIVKMGLDEFSVEAGDERAAKTAARARYRELHGDYAVPFAVIVGRRP
jgi:hypothetical protein